MKAKVTDLLMNAGSGGAAHLTLGKQQCFVQKLKQQHLSLPVEEN